MILQVHSCILHRSPHRSLFTATSFPEKCVVFISSHLTVIFQSPYCDVSSPIPESPHLLETARNNLRSNSNIDLELFDRSALGAVDTIKELTNILVADEARLVDQSSGTGDVINIDTLDEDLILGRLGLDGLSSPDHIDDTVDLLSQEVLDGDALATIDNLSSDRKVRIHQSHMVSVALGNTRNHIVDVGADRAQASRLLGQSEEEADLNLLSTIDLGDGPRKVTEVTLQLTLWALDNHLTGLDVHGHALRDRDGVGATDQLHFFWFWRLLLKPMDLPGASSSESGF